MLFRSSGGHTTLFYVKSYNEYDIIGSTRDDAAGEAFDKIAKLLGLSYPGGPELDKLARKGLSTKFDFPRSMINSGDYQFSFSGLKTSVRYFIDKRYPNGIPSEVLPDIAASAQEAIVDVLIKKSIEAAVEYKTKSIVIAGGVSANSRLREKLNNTAKKKNINIIAPDMNYCMDNAAMIGFIAEKKFDEKPDNFFMNLKFTVSSNAIRAKRK